MRKILRFLSTQLAYARCGGIQTCKLWMVKTLVLRNNGKDKALTRDSKQGEVINSIEYYSYNGLDQMQ